MGPQKKSGKNLNEHSEQTYWSYEITIFFLCIDIGTKLQKLFRKKKNLEFRKNLKNLHPWDYRLGLGLSLALVFAA